MEGPDAKDAATARATAEASYQYAAAKIQAATLQSLATATGATGQQVFDYQRGVAEVSWISSVTPAFIDHETSVAYVEEYWRPYQLAVNPPPAEDDPSSWPQWTTTEILREASDEFLEAAYSTAATSQELSRNLAHAHHARVFSVAQAKADRQQAVDSATEDKTYSLSLLEDDASSNVEAENPDSSTGLEHEAAIADIALTHVTDTEDAKLAFQEDETDSRGQYSLNLATAQNERDQNLAANAQSVALTEANYQYGADAAFASAEEADWSHETSIDNTVALAKAQADVVLWTAQESANVSAAQSIDTALNIPWTHYLVAEAQAHADWWQYTGGPEYIQWVQNENAAQSTWQSNINSAHAAEALQERNGKSAEAITFANAAYTEAATEANAAFSYLADPTTGVLASAKTYLDSLAQDNHDLAIDLAQAVADRTQAELDGDEPDEVWTEYEDSVAGYQQDYNGATSLNEAQYTLAAQNARVGLLTSDITVQHDRALTVDAAVRDREINDAIALDTYETADSGAYVWITQQFAQLDENYALFEASGLKAMADSLAAGASTASAFATYFAAQMDAYDLWSIATAAAQYTQRVTSAQAQAGLDANGDPTGGGEIAESDAERDSAITGANNSYAQQVADTSVNEAEIADEIGTENETPPTSEPLPSAGDSGLPDVVFLAGTFIDLGDGGATSTPIDGLVVPPGAITASTPPVSSDLTFTPEETNRFVGLALGARDPALGSFWLEHGRVVIGGMPERQDGGPQPLSPPGGTSLERHFADGVRAPEAQDDVFVVAASDELPTDVANRVVDSLLLSAESQRAQVDANAEFDGVAVGRIFLALGADLAKRLSPNLTLGLGAAASIVVTAGTGYRPEFFEVMGKAFLNALSVNSTEKERNAVGAMIDLIQNATLPDGRKAWEIHHTLYQQGKSFKAWIENFAPKGIDVHDVKNLVAVPTPVHELINGEQTAFWTKIMKEEGFSGNPNEYPKLFAKLEKDPTKSARIMGEYQAEMKRITAKYSQYFVKVTDNMDTVASVIQKVETNAMKIDPAKIKGFTSSLVDKSNKLKLGKVFGFVLLGGATVLPLYLMLKNGRGDEFVKMMDFFRQSLADIESRGAASREHVYSAILEGFVPYMQKLGVDEAKIETIVKAMLLASSTL